LTPFPRLLILLQLFLTSREISKSYMSILCDQDFTGSKSRNKVSVGEPAEGSLQQNKNG
jgi:hypothetical protein